MNVTGIHHETALPDVAAAAVAPAIAVHVGGQQPLHPGVQVVRAARPEDEVEVVGHRTKADEPQGHAGTGQAEQPHEAVVVVGIVEDLRPAVTAVEDVVAVATDRGSRSPGHAAIIAAGGLCGKGVQAFGEAPGAASPANRPRSLLPPNP